MIAVLDPCRTSLGAPPGALSALALRLADHARALGLRVVALQASHVANSRSQYLRLEDRRARCWLVRVSDHPQRPCATRRERPHLDLVIDDPSSGDFVGRQWLGLVVAGEVVWRDPTAGVRLAPQRRRR